jgi:DNA polymerase-3 subunit beta
MKLETRMKPALAATTAAAALAAYDRAVSEGAACDVAHMLAAVLRKPKAEKPAAGAADLRWSAKAFAAAVARCCEVAPKAAPAEIVRCLRLKVEGGFVALFATDLDMQYSTTLTDAPLPDMDLCVTAHDLKGAVQGATDLSLTRDDGACLVVVADGVTRRLRARPAHEFPLLALRDYPARATMNGAELADMLRFVAPAISTEETRYYLNGVAFVREVADGAARLRLVATDGHRMAIAGTADPFTGTVQGVSGASAVVPRAAVAVLRKRLGAGTVEIEICDKDGAVTNSPPQARFVTADGVLTTKLIDGFFPDFWRVVPRGDFATRVEIDDTKAFAAALASVARVSCEKSRSVRLESANGGLDATVRNLDGEEAKTGLPCTVTGDATHAGFNSAYLRDAVSAYGRAILLMEAPYVVGPARVEYPDAPGERIGVLMPLRV